MFKRKMRNLKSVGHSFSRHPHSLPACSNAGHHLGPEPYGYRQTDPGESAEVMRLDLYPPRMLFCSNHELSEEGNSELSLAKDFHRPQNISI